MRTIVRGVFRDFQLITYIFLILDVLIYFDRGILPGLHAEVVEDLPHSPELLYGILQSIFIGGLAVSAPLLAYWSIKTQNLLVFVAAGVTLWNLSLFGFSLAAWLRLLVPLFIFRAMSGVGEAAFSSLVIPAMLDCQPQKRRGVLLGVFYALMPLGVSLGYVMSASLPVLFGLSYAAAFGFLGAAAIPYTMVIVAISCLPESRGLSPWQSMGRKLIGADNDDPCRPETAEHTPKQEREDIEEGMFGRLKSPVSRRQIRTPQIPDRLGSSPSRGTINELGKDYNTPFFLSLTVAGAALAAVNATLASFGSALLLDLGIFSSELAASCSVGTIAMGVGAAGTVAGGILTQSYMNSINEDDRTSTGRMTASIIFAAGFCGSGVALVAPIFLYYHLGAPSLITLSLGLFFLCLCQAPLNLGIMSSCKRTHRALALSLYTLSIHFMGDVPGPVVIGWLKDLAESVCSDLSDDGCIDARRARLLALIVFLLMWTVPIWLGGGLALLTA